jgi:hypothetical protein
MTRKTLAALSFAMLVGTLPFRADAGTLRGSPSSMKKQHEIAVDEDLPFSGKPSEVEHLVESGKLVTVEDNADFALSKVSFPYARPEVLLFIQRLSAQYHAELGTRLVVTSLTRPVDRQPKNAHELSVHPAGMAVDFRIPSTPKARSWLENALLGLENERVLDVTREHTPPHYHVAVYPAEYLAYAAKMGPVKPVATLTNAVEPVPVAPIRVAQPAPTDQRASVSGPMLVASVFTLILIGVAGLIGAGRLKIPARRP